MTTPVELLACEVLVFDEGVEERFEYLFNVIM
jgi:hypothetical protein